MKIMVMLPSGKSSYPIEEIEVRRSYLKELVSPGIDMEIGFVQGEHGFKNNLVAADFDFDEEFIIPAQEAEKEGFDAVMVHCVFDPGIASAKKIIKMPVIGPGEASMVFLKSLGKKFGILAPFDSLVERTYDIVKTYGLSEQVTPIGALNIPLPEAKRRREELLERAMELSRKAISEGAELILPFGLALIPAHLRCEVLSEQLGVPVVNPAEIGIKFAELAAKITKR